MAKKTKKKTTKPAAASKKKASARAKVSKKPTAKKTASKTKASSSRAKKGATTKKTAAKKTTKKSTKSAGTKKSAAKKPAAKKSTTKKTGVKKPAAKKSTAKKTASKKTPAKKAPAKSKSTAKKTTKKSTTPKKTSGSAKAGGASQPSAKAKASDKTPSDKSNNSKKSGRKGITIVSDRSKKRGKTKQPRKPFVTPGGSLLGPGVVRKPLIPSGPNAEAAAASTAADSTAPKKSPFNKRELTKFKNLLLIKRAELFGDIEQMEADALRSNSGNLSHLPQHLADQGSDSYEQSLSLDLAAADRRLIKEIDDALARIDNRTYGVCERTGKPIHKTRLQELPWARYSIEAAREMERRGGGF